MCVCVHAHIARSPPPPIFHSFAQPWVAGLLASHVLVALVAILLRKSPNAQLSLFLLICGVVYSAEWVNGYLGQHWKELGWTQNYFDQRGVFITIVFCVPLLLIAAAQMVRRGAGEPMEKGEEVNRRVFCWFVVVLVSDHPPFPLTPPFSLSRAALRPVHRD
jgi:hypothetical protein